MWYKITEPVTQVSLGPSLARKEQAAKSCGHSKKLCVASRSQRQMLGNRQQEAEALSPPTHKDLNPIRDQVSLEAKPQPIP